MKDNKFTLVIVDLQYDFYNPYGTLYVKGGEKILEKIDKFIYDNKDNINEIIFTLDWHPYNHESFKNYGGGWDSHCVEYTKGVGIPTWLLLACYNLHLPVKFSKKGYDWEEYGAFNRIKRISYYNDNKELSYYSLNCASNIKDNEITTLSTDFVVCGLCGDYCVLETIKNLRKIPEFNIKAYLDGILSIDGGKKLNKYIEETKLETI